MATKWAHERGRAGPVRRLGNLRYYALEGLIAVQDERDGSFVAITPADWEQRQQALRDFYKYRQPTSPHDQDMYRMLRSVVPGMAAAIKEAKAMGDPSDPKVQAYWTKHRRKGQIAFHRGPMTNLDGYPDLPELPRGRHHGHHVSADYSLDAPTHARKIPTRKASQKLVLPL